jgi:hypothetical protein
LYLFFIAFYLKDVSFLQAQLFAIFITGQFTGNLKESIIPYVLSNANQLKRIDKSEAEQSQSEYDTAAQNIEKLKRYSENFFKQNQNMEPTEGEEDDENSILNQKNDYGERFQTKKYKIWFHKKKLNAFY